MSSYVGGSGGSDLLGRVAGVRNNLAYTSWLCHSIGEAAMGRMPPATIWLQREADKMCVVDLKVRVPVDDDRRVIATRLL